MKAAWLPTSSQKHWTSKGDHVTASTSLKVMKFATVISENCFQAFCCDQQILGKPLRFWAPKELRHVEMRRTSQINEVAHAISLES